MPDELLLDMSAISWKGANALELLGKLVLAHVPVINFDFREKCFYITYMVRQIILAEQNPEVYLDDKDYYGNKRLELAGSLLSLLFEDLFKRFNTDLSRQADNYLQEEPRGCMGLHQAHSPRYNHQRLQSCYIDRQLDVAAV